jgi:hypothetical protein
MKKSILARGFIGSVASLLGVVAVGCSGEVMDEATAGNGEIGSVAEALTVNSPLSSKVTLAQSRIRAALCQIKDTDSDDVYTIMAGGQLLNSSKAATNTIISSLEGDAAYVTAAATLSASHFDAVAIQHPSDPTKCLVTGGRVDGSTVTNKVDEIKFDNGAIVVTPRADMQVARAKHQLSICNGKLIAFGGENGSATPLRDIEVSAASPYSAAWTNTANALAVARTDFALVKDGANDRYVAAGGLGASLTLLDTYELIEPTSCTPASTLINSPVLADQVQGNFGVFDQTVSATETQFFFAGGSDGAALETTGNVIEVDWSNNIVSNVRTETITGTRNPVLVPIATGQTMIVGGQNVAGTAAVDAVQQWVSGDLDSSPGTMSVPRFSPGAFFVASHGKVFVSSGERIGSASPADKPLTTEDITP